MKTTSINKWIKVYRFSIATRNVWNFTTRIQTDAIDYGPLFYVSSVGIGQRHILTMYCQKKDHASLFLHTETIGLTTIWKCDNRATQQRCRSSSYCKVKDECCENVLTEKGPHLCLLPALKVIDNIVVTGQCVTNILLGNRWYLNRKSAAKKLNAIADNDYINARQLSFSRYRCLDFERFSSNWIGLNWIEWTDWIGCLTYRSTTSFF